jgi:hypothetical protein
MNIKDIIVRINKLNSKEQLHILNILKTNNVKFSKNANGYFFNFIDINDNILDKIYKCVELIESNTDLLKEMDKRRNELLIYYKQLIEDKLNLNIKLKKDNYIKKLRLYDDNIKLNIKRVNRINRRVLYDKDKDKDIDIVMKEYLKSRSKYKKDSIHYKIMIKIKSKNKYEYKKCDVDNFEEDEYDIDPFTSKDSGCETDIESIKDDIESIKDDMHSIKDDFSQEEYTDIFENYDNKSLEDNISLDENNNDSIFDNEGKHRHNFKSDNNMELEIDYYRKLLNKQGFVFDDNKRCLLQIEEYIK